MTEESPSLSIIIINWNSKEYIRACLKSIYRYASELQPQIIIVDGASFDGCGEMLAKEFPDVVFIQSDKNIGFGRCNNLGAERATGELLLFLNPDTVITRNALQLLLEAFNLVSPNSLLGARLLNSDGSLQTTSVLALPTPLNKALASELLLNLFPKSQLWGTYKAYASNELTEVEAISGACMLVPKKLFQNVGGFTESFFMYAEDMDLCYKVRKNCGGVFHVPHSEIVHHGGGSSSNQYSHFSIISMQTSLYHYFLINHNTDTAEQYRRYISLSAALRTLFFLPIAFLGKTSLHKWWTILKWSVTHDYTVPPESKVYSIII